MKYKTLLLDVDGTLVGLEDSPIGHDYRLKRSLDVYMERGGEIGLVTGRSEYYTSAIYEFLGLNGVRIVEMGAGIIMPDNSKIKLTSLENNSEIREFLKTIGALEIMLEEPKSFMISLILPEFPHHNIRKLKSIYDNIIAKGFLHELPESLITVDDYSIDIYNPKSDKGEAIKLYAERTEKNLTEIAIIGDSKGDYPGFKVIGNSGGFIGYVGLDKEFGQKLKEEFSKLYIAKVKRSSGVVEIIDYLLKD